MSQEEKYPVKPRIYAACKSIPPILGLSSAGICALLVDYVFMTHFTHSFAAMRFYINYGDFLIWVPVFFICYLVLFKTWWMIDPIYRVVFKGEFEGLDQANARKSSLVMRELELKKRGKPLRPVAYRICGGSDYMIMLFFMTLYSMLMGYVFEVLLVENETVKEFYDAFLLYIMLVPIVLFCGLILWKSRQIQEKAYRVICGGKFERDECP